MSNDKKDGPDLPGRGGLQPGDALWHGGDLGRARRLFPEAPQPWIDLSTGINPVAYPLGELPPQAFRSLPAPEDQQRLEACAARAYGAPLEGVALVAAPGTQVLIELLPRLRAPGRVAVLGPTYGEHALCWRKAGHEVDEVSALEAAGGADVVVIVNPNNPDGRKLSRGQLVRAAAALAARGGLLVVDEAFADFDNGESLIPELPGHAVVLRSFGKTYGLAGVRLGFLAAPAAMALEVRDRLGPWAVSGPALVIGARALADRAWLQAAAADRARDAARLDALVAPVLGPPIGGTRLFRTFSSARAGEAFELLGRAGIFVRRFSYDPLLLRIGLPAGEAQWAQLATALDPRAEGAGSGLAMGQGA